MPKFQFAASYPAAIVAKLSGDGKAKLKEWIKNSTFAPGEPVWLVDTPLCEVRLALTDAAADDASNWSGETFSASAKLLDITVVADTADKAYDVLVVGLFSRFDGQPATGEASFPVCAGAPVKGNGQIGDVLVVQHDKQFTAGVGDDVSLEYLTVKVHRDDGIAANWKLLP